MKITNAIIKELQFVRHQCCGEVYYRFIPDRYALELRKEDKEWWVRSKFFSREVSSLQDLVEAIQDHAYANGDYDRKCIMKEAMGF